MIISLMVTQQEGPAVVQVFNPKSLPLQLGQLLLVPARFGARGLFAFLPSSPYHFFTSFLAMGVRSVKNDLVDEPFSQRTDKNMLMAADVSNALEDQDVHQHSAGHFFEPLRPLFVDQKDVVCQHSLKAVHRVFVRLDEFDVQRFKRKHSGKVPHVVSLLTTSSGAGIPRYNHDSVTYFTIKK